MRENPWGSIVHTESENWLVLLAFVAIPRAIAAISVHWRSFMSVKQTIWPLNFAAFLFDPTKYPQKYPLGKKDALRLDSESPVHLAHFLEVS
jgi:hypothetical protein